MTGAAPQNNGQTPPDEQTRADVYRLLGVLLASPPDTALLQLLRGIEPDAAAEDGPMTGAWRSLRAAAERADPASLEEEYFNLFIGLGRGELVPYASYYLNGLLMEKALAELRGELAGLGIRRREDVAEPEDHVAAVCEVMGMIISGGGLQLNQLNFFTNFVDSWVGRFFADLATAEKADFYRAVASLGEAFVAVERQYLSLPA